MFYYWAFGLTITSEIYFPELYQMQSFSKTDIEIKSGKTPTEIEAVGGFISDNLIISPDVYILKIHGVASYHVEAGKKIIIEFNEVANMNEVRLFCLSNAFAALLQQRRLVPLHAAAFIHENELILLMGESGVGKSTTLAAMINKGYSPFSDDICIPYYNFHDGHWHAYSSYPMMKYWEDTFKKVDMENVEKARKLRPTLDKYGVFFHQKFISESRRIKLLIMLQIDSKHNAVYSRELNGIESFDKIQDQAYRKEYLVHESMIKDHFIQSSEIAKSVKTILVSRPVNTDSISSVVEFIDTVLHEKNLVSPHSNLE